MAKKAAKKKQSKPRVKLGSVADLDARFSRKELAEIDAAAEAQVAELTLQGLRNALGMTQTDLARRIHMAQAQVSKLESGNDHLISTLRKVIEGMGGKLVIKARIGDHDYRIRLAGDPPAGENHAE